MNYIGASFYHKSNKETLYRIEERNEDTIYVKWEIDGGGRSPYKKRDAERYIQGGTWKLVEKNTIESEEL